MTFTNEIIHLWNQLTGNHNGEAPTYASSGDALRNRNPIYPSDKPLSIGDLRGADPNYNPWLNSASEDPNQDPDVVPPTSGYSGYSGNRSQNSSRVVYYDAPMAQKYGMSAATAYSEALANTAHQREMQDLIKAGLNPVLTANGGSGASVVSGEVYSPAAGRSSFGHSAKVEDQDNPWFSLIGSIVTAVSGKSAVGKAVKQGLSDIGEIMNRDSN